MPKEKQLLLISWVREANKRLIDERKCVALIVEARKLGLIQEIQRLDKPPLLATTVAPS